MGQALATASPRRIGPIGILRSDMASLATTADRPAVDLDLPDRSGAGPVRHDQRPRDHPVAATQIDRGRPLPLDAAERLQRREPARPRRVVSPTLDEQAHALRPFGIPFVVEDGRKVDAVPGSDLLLVQQDRRHGDPSRLRSCGRVHHLDPAEIQVAAQLGGEVAAGHAVTQGELQVDLADQRLEPVEGVRPAQVLGHAGTTGIDGRARNRAATPCASAGTPRQ